VVQNENIGIEGPKILTQDLVYFGIRDYEEAEEKVIHDQGIKYFKVEELRFKGLKHCVQEAIQLLSKCDYTLY